MTFPIKKKRLISIVQSMEGFSSPNVKLEQYVTDAISTVDFLYFIAVDNNDVVENIILDLGAGTGRLGLTSLLLGAKKVIAVEMDKLAIQVMKENAENLDLIPYIDIIQADISHMNEEQLHDLNESLRLPSCDTRIVCVMNPPFGVQNKKADRPFLLLAMKVSDVIYSIHLSNPKTRSYFQRFVSSHGWEIKSIHSQKMIIEGNFSFHKKKRKEILTDVYKIEKKID